MANLQSQLNTLATNFANQVMATLQGASLHDLASSGGGGNVGNGRPVQVVAGGDREAPPLSTRAAAKGKNGRLARRSADEIAAMLNKIVLLVKTQKNGLRAEEIRSKLGLLPKEMPRILKEGISTKKLTSKGQKRATTYFAR
ncbi:MAG TPA: hypothetical protein VK762_29205 [Polyangiaceae bacterium]|jgi:hypothetical protein|nr:hypothetical protein [Polyangiaceae bacterium]